MQEEQHGHTLYINVFGVLLVAITLPWFVQLILAISSSDISAQIANSHTVFNVLSAVIFLPITKYYVKFLETVIRGKDKLANASMYLDKLLLDTPVAALRASILELIRGTEISKNMVKNIIDGFVENDEKKLELVKKDEATINQLQKDVTSYIVNLSKRQLTDSQSIMVPAMINSINNVERIGDHTIDIFELCQVKIEKRLDFTKEAMDELRTIEGVIVEMLDNTIIALREQDMDMAAKNTILEDRVDELSKEFQNRHIERLDDDKCNVESGVVFIDVVNHLERIADHIYKITLLSTDGLQGYEKSLLPSVEL